MSEKEMKIMGTLQKAIEKASDITKYCLLGWAEGAAYAVCGAVQPESVPLCGSAPGAEAGSEG